MKQEDEDRIAGLGELALYLNMSVKTVKRLICCEGLPAVKIGGSWVSSKELIRHWRQEKILRGLRHGKKR